MIIIIIIYFRCILLICIKLLYFFFQLQKNYDEMNRIKQIKYFQFYGYYFLKQQLILKIMNDFLDFKLLTVTMVMISIIININVRQSKGKNIFYIIKILLNQLIYFKKLATETIDNDNQLEYVNCFICGVSKCPTLTSIHVNKHKQNLMTNQMCQNECLKSKLFVYSVTFNG